MGRIEDAGYEQAANAKEAITATAWDDANVAGAREIGGVLRNAGPE